MMDCKTALTETKGDIEQAIDWLRKKGLSKAAKKSDRVAAEGLVGIVTSGTHRRRCGGQLRDRFRRPQRPVPGDGDAITSISPAVDGDVAKLLASTYPGKTVTVDEVVKETIATIGENMNVRRTATVAVKEGVVADYMHSKVADGLGKIGVIVGLESKGDEPTLFALGRQIAMHIAARNPVALDISGVPADILAREKAILLDKNKGKPEKVLEKIAESGLKTYAKENCLLEQVFVLDESKTIAQALKEAEKTAGAPVKIAGYVRYALGEGIEKKEDDFAAEVAAAAKG